MPADSLVHRVPSIAPRAAGPRPAKRPWTWKLGEIAGIEIFVHVSLVIVLGGLFVAQLTLGAGTAHALVSLALLASVFAVIVLHELGHALVARRFGARTRDITLWPIGGIARLERMPERPGQELAVALAGPAVNLAIAGVLAAIIAATGGALGPEALVRADAGFATKLVWINLSLAAFNLVPAFPMDGGRVLRAALALRFGRLRATAIAARVARWLAVGLGALGILWNPMLLVIAVFVYFGAGAESAMVQVEAALVGEPVKNAMIPGPRVVERGASLGDVAGIALATTQSVFPIVDDAGRLAGVLDRNELVRALATAGPRGPVDPVMRRDLPLAGADEPVVDVLHRLAGETIVIDGAGRPIGLISPDAIDRAAAIRTALYVAAARR
jgi:Zn-dependent protease